VGPTYEDKDKRKEFRSEDKDKDLVDPRGQGRYSRSTTLHIKLTLTLDSKIIVGLSGGSRIL